MNIRVLALSLSLVSVATVACASGKGSSPGASSTVSSQGMGGMDHGTTFAFGEPGDPADAVRTVRIDALDTLRFAPASIEVAVGDTVTFELTNAGEIAHEFVLGDAATQDEHQGQMGQSMMSDEPNSVSLSPAEGASLTWTFTEPGTVLYACHVDDHFAGGMVGEISVGNG